MIEKNNEKNNSKGGVIPEWAEKVVIRPAANIDLKELEWEGEFANFRKVYAEVFDRMQKGFSIMWVADLLSWGIIGQVFVQLVSKSAELADGHHRAYVHSYRVRPEYRHAGVGSRLMHTAEADLQKRGYSEVCLNVAKNNPLARRIYDHLGYQVISKNSGKWWYYDQYNELQYVNEPSWRMLKKINT